MSQDRSVSTNHPWSQPPQVLTIAGSDSGGAAGLQADLKTFTALQTYGMSVITVVTAQNSWQVQEVHFLPAAFVAAQLDAVLADYGAKAVKTGFLGRVDLIATVAATLSAYRQPNIIIDPVLVNHRGEAMFATEVVTAYRQHLLPLATLLTPNRHEAALLLDQPVAALHSLAALATAVRQLHALGPQNVLLKGGPRDNQSIDLLFDGRQITRFASPLLQTANTHGSGDTLSAAVAAGLAAGLDLQTAVSQAHQFTAVAIQKAAGWQLGQGHGPLAHW